MTASVLFHVQYLLGIGHLQRSLRIAEALAKNGVAVTLVSGGEPVPGLPLDPAIRFVQLEPIRARDARFDLIDSSGNPIDDALRDRRRRALLATFADARPDVVVVEGFPFARRAFRFELDPLIAAVRGRTPRPRLICSVRDIVVMRPDPARHRQAVDCIRTDFDAVLVHGDPTLVPFEASFPAAPQIADRLVYTGYVGSAPDQLNAPARDVGEVLVSAGGGPSGRMLLATALAARKEGCRADRPWRILTGAGLPEDEFAGFARDAPADVAVERFRHDFRSLLRYCGVSVSQAGYNTVLDILAARVPAVLVPFAAERETEQLLRAGRLAALGVAEMVREADLSVSTLSRAIERAATREPAEIAVDIAGAARSVEFITALIKSGKTPRSGLATGLGARSIRQ